MSELDSALETAIDALLDARSEGASICPSEVARHVRPRAWRALMQQTRDVAARLAAQGLIEITQRGRVIDPVRVRGPIRLRRPTEKMRRSNTIVGRSKPRARVGWLWALSAISFGYRRRWKADVASDEEFTWLRVSSWSNSPW